MVKHKSTVFSVDGLVVNVLVCCWYFYNWDESKTIAQESKSSSKAFVQRNCRHQLALYSPTKQAASSSYHPTNPWKLLPLHRSAPEHKTALLPCCTEAESQTRKRPYASPEKIALREAKHGGTEPALVT